MYPCARDNEMTCKQARAAVVSRPASYAALLAAGLGLLAFPVLAAGPADTILVNGKIVTVDGRFTIAQGVAIRGQRIVAVGATAKILKLKGADTKVIDLVNKTVIPGLIDNHAHFIRAPEHDEMRFDGVTSRRRALAMLAERVRAAKPGEWIVTLGGWSEEQFTDDPRGFPLDELDRIAPGNPVVLQAVYNQSYLNGAALKAIGINEATPDPRGVSEKHYEAYKALADRGELNARAFWTTIRQPATAEQVDKVLGEIQQHTPFQGSDYFENIGWGESVYTPATTNLLRNDFVVRPEDMREVRRIAHAVAEGGMFLNAHVEMENAIDAYLDEYEAINKVEPIKGLRWAFSHKVHGERAWDMPPFRRVQDSGIVWGLGSDATAVTTSNPFYTLSFAVTGRMIGGREVNRQTVAREEALIAHTRSNAYFIFQESNLGSIQPGKYADLVVLDLDYLKVPADRIKDIKPVMTMVGGKVVHQAKGM